MSAVVDFVKGAVNTVLDLGHKAIDLVVDTVKAVIADPLPTLLMIAGATVGIPVPLTAAAVTAARGGSLEDIAKSAVGAYVGQEVAPVISGSIAPTVGGMISNQAVATAVTNAITSGLVNGTVSAIQGGDFAKGFTGGFVGSAVGAGAKEIIGKPTMDFAKSLGFDEQTGKAIVTALSSSVGKGAGAAATGGDFSAAFERGLATSGVNFAATKASDAIKETLKNETSSNDAELRAKYEQTTKINQDIQANAAAQQKAVDDANARAIATNDKQTALQNEINKFNDNIKLSQSDDLRDNIYGQMNQLYTGYDPESETSYVPPENAAQFAALQKQLNEVYDDQTRADIRADLVKRAEDFTKEYKDSSDYVTKQQEQLKTLQQQQIDLIKQYDQVTSGTKQSAADFFTQEEKNAERIKQAYDLNEQYKTLTGQELTPEKLVELQKADNLKEAAAKDLGFDSVESMQTALTMKSLPTDVAPKLEGREGEIAGQLVKETLEDGSVVYSRTFTGTTPDGQKYSYKATYDEKNPRGVEYEVLNGVSQNYKSGTPVDVVSGTERPNFGVPPAQDTGTTTETKKTAADLQKDAADAYNNFVNTSVIATQVPTPENVDAANQAKLDAELKQKMADDAMGVTNTGTTDTTGAGSTGSTDTLAPINQEELPVKSNQTLPISDNVGNNVVPDNTTSGLGNVLGDAAKTILTSGLTSGTSGTSGSTTTAPTATAKTAAVAPVVTSGLTPVAKSNTASPSIYFEAPNIMMTPAQIAERESFSLGRRIKRGGLASKRKK
jgi:hypothetical protein